MTWTQFLTIMIPCAVAMVLVIVGLFKSNNSAHGKMHEKINNNHTDIIEKMGDIKVELNEKINTAENKIRDKMNGRQS